MIFLQKYTPSIAGQLRYLSIGGSNVLNQYDHLLKMVVNKYKISLICNVTLDMG